MTETTGRLRTHEEIAVRVAERRSRDPLGFEAAALVPYLPFAFARPFLKPGATEATWDDGSLPVLDALAVRRRISDYMEFAWGKVEDHRGISAARSVQKLGAWCWLIGRDDLADLADDEGQYAQYGAPILRQMCEALELPWPHEDEAVVRMSQGDVCRRGCEDGCGS